MKRIAIFLFCLLWGAAASAAVIKTIQAGATDQTVVIKIIDSTDGTPETGVVFNTSGIDLEYWRHGANSVTDITEATQTVSGAHADGGFIHLGNGYYRLDLPDAAVATGATAVEIMGTVTGMIVIGGTVDLSPPVNVVAYGGTAGTFASGRPEVNTSHIAGSAVSTSTAQIGVNVVNAAGTAWGSGAITAASIATDAIGSAEIADGAIDAGALATDTITAAKIAADAIGSSELATGAITTAEFAAGAIDAAAIATDAIGAAEVAAGAIAADAFAAGAIDSSAIAADAIGASEVAADAIGSSELATDAIGAAEIAASAIAAAEIADGAIDEATYATTAGSFDPLGIIDQGTAQAATGTTLQLRSAATFADDEIIGATCVITGGTTGVGQSRTVTDYVSSTDTATVATWTTTPTGTVTYQCFGTAASTGGSGATAAEVADAVWDEDMTAHQTQGTAGQVIGDSAADTDSIWSLANTNLNATVSSRASQTSLDTVDDYVDTEVAAILVDTGTTLDDFVDDLETRLGTPTNLGGGATVAANLSDIEGQTDDIGAAGAGLTAADDAVLAAIAALNNLSAAQIRDLVVEDQGSLSLGCLLAAIGAVNAGDVTTAAGTSTFEESTGAETRVTAVVSGSTRTVTITCPTY